MGFRNELKTFQRTINGIMPSVKWQFAHIYLYYKVVLSRTPRQYMDYVRKILSLLHSTESHWSSKRVSFSRIPLIPVDVWRCKPTRATFKPYVFYYNGNQLRRPNQASTGFANSLKLRAFWHNLTRMPRNRMGHPPLTKIPCWTQIYYPHGPRRIKMNPQLGRLHCTTRKIAPLFIQIRRWSHKPYWSQTQCIWRSIAARHKWQRHKRTQWWHFTTQKWHKQLRVQTAQFISQHLHSFFLATNTCRAFLCSEARCLLPRDTYPNWPFKQQNLTSMLTTFQSDDHASMEHHRSSYRRLSDSASLPCHIIHGLRNTPANLNCINRYNTNETGLTWLQTSNAMSASATAARRIVQHISTSTSISSVQ